ncbi:Kiwa anti-phage protein KwaB-like domain-containing protein [Gephyromycinifex aptenodytis]|uniref:Kiwa anti-phage protein KwaB-like domain-containing protein n=1 Tax=Gephyromycinifex aptenodytis TaxID=2716227 RepID=UPI001444F836|nr:Kiwa anti-phage protein KwaB-like domain-containing protein [Gephyromycinifex aptenodytis]
MNTEKARELLAAASEKQSAAAVAGNFVIRGGTLADAQVTRFDLDNGLAAEVASDVAGAAAALAEKQFLAYDPSYQTDSGQVLVEALEDIPELAALDEVVRGGDVGFDTGDSESASVLAMAHIIGSGAARIVAYRMKGPGIATRRARAIPLLPRDGVYRRVDGDILYYEPRFDVYTCGGHALFTTVSLIHTKLQADRKARHMARKTLKQVTKDIAIDGYPDLEAAVMDDPTMRAKMAAIARLIENDPDYRANLTTDKLVTFVQAYPDYNIPLAQVQGRTVLAFDPSPQHRHQIPRLLADDYLHSYLTNRRYEAGSKQRVQAE